MLVFKKNMKLLLAPSQRKAAFQIKPPDKNGVYVVEYLPTEIGIVIFLIESYGNNVSHVSDMRQGLIKLPLMSTVKKLKTVHLFATFSTLTKFE